MTTSETPEISPSSAPPARVDPLQPRSTLATQLWPAHNQGRVLVGGVAIALLIFGAGAVRLLTANSSADDVPVAEVIPVRSEVVALGRVEPVGEVLRIGGPSGERIAELRVERGSLVQAGDVLAVLESYGEEAAQRDLVASQLAEAERRLRAETQVGQSQIQEAQTRIRQVEDPSQFEVAAQQARIRELEASYSLADQDLQRNRNLFAEGAISQQDLDRQATQVRELREQVSNAQASLVQLERSQQASLRNARAQLQSQQATLSLSQVQAAVESARQNLALAEARLDRTLIRAPRSGRVLRVITDVGEALGQDGLLDMGDTSQMYIVAEVYETDIGLVKPGQRATINSRNGAFEDTLGGTVEDLGWQIFKNDVLDDDPAANADARVVEVRIRLDNGTAVEGLTNLQVDVRIDVES